jgi:DNA-binding NarL/FixJ family response regulator
MHNTKVFLIDAHELSREGLKLLLHCGSYEIIARHDRSTRPARQSPRGSVPI